MAIRAIKERGGYRKFTNAERLEIVRKIKDKKDVERVADKHGISPTTITGWFLRFKAFGEADFAEEQAVKGAATKAEKFAALEARVARLEKELGVEE